MVVIPNKLVRPSKSNQFLEQGMTLFQIQLYNNLLQLTIDSETFYFQDFDLDGITYRIFNYRLSSYTEFLRPGALECRGIMFEVIADLPMRLASMPMEKFFNLHENPMTMDLDLTTVVGIEDKADGSLMSTYMHNNQLRLKSKGSLFSQQALDAMKWIDRAENAEFKTLLHAYANLGITVNMEWVAPFNRIVIGYLEPKLIILNLRADSGHYVEIPPDSTAAKYAVKKVDTHGLDLVAFVNQIPDMQDDIEGFILRLESGQRVKVKTKKYMSLHHAKDSINNPRRLFEAVVDEGIDDLRSMFFEDKLAMQLIDEMQTKVSQIYNHMANLIESFYLQNRHLDRKSFAIKAQAEVQQLYFGQVMNMYVGKDVDYKAFMKAKYKELGFKDTTVDPVE